MASTTTRAAKTAATKTASRARSTVESSPVAGWTGRTGLVSRGVIYCVVAVLAVQIAVGDHSEEADREGALSALARYPSGTALLVVLAAGFAAYAAWRFLKAFTGAPEGGKRNRSVAAGLALRAADVARGALYVSLFFSTVGVIRSGHAHGDSDEHAKTWSARFMSQPGGRWVVAAVGLALIAVGVVRAVSAVRQKFERHLDRRHMTHTQRRWLPVLGTAGYVGRAAVWASGGAFLIEAAVRFDPNRAEGIDGSLHRLADRGFGPALLILVAVGLACFGLFSFVEARWRKVLDG
jgi:protein-S-isoprenylcysteine O-methyltransferase Ste14